VSAVVCKPMRPAILAAFLPTTVALAGCGLLLPPNDPTPPATACPAALLQGRLAPDGEGGALVVMDDGTEMNVVWPDGYVVRSEPVPNVELLDQNGNLIASEGDTIYAGGGFSPDDSQFVACGEVSTEPP
jgi:hypothetical protein